MPYTPSLPQDDLPATPVGATGPGGSTTPEDIEKARQAAMVGTDPNAPARAAAAKAAAEAAAREQAYQASYQYGGWAGGAAEAATRYNNAGINAQQRPGEQIDYTNALADRGQAQQARGSQMGMADLMRARAEGRTPSIAGMMADRQMGQAAAEQSSAAASARGPAALALAQQQAAGNTAQMQSNISGQAQINAANERMQAEQNAYGAYSGVRSGDMQAGGMAAQQAQTQAALNAAQRAQNDQYQLGMTGYETDVQKAQLAAQGNKIAVQAGQAQSQAALSQAKAMHDQDRSDGWWKVAAGGAAAVGGTVLTALLPSSGANNSPVPSGTAGAAPGSGGTQGGYNPDAPTVATTQDGGFDPSNPNDPDSDARAKVLQTWGSAPTPVDPVASAKSEAHAALDAQGQPAAAPTRPARILGDQAQAGMSSLRDRDAEDYGLIKAKERNGAALTAKEEATRGALRRRIIGDRQLKERKDTLRGAVKGAAPAPGPAGKSVGEGIGNNLSAMGMALMQGNGAPRFDSDMVSKDPAPMPAPPAAPPVGGNAPLPPMTPHEKALMAQAGGMQANMQAQNAAMLSAGPAVRPSFDSDDRTKLAAAWDQGHNDALNQLQDMRMKSPEELKALGGKGNRIANALRGAKGDAFDEARGVNQPMRMPMREPTSFTRGASTVDTSLTPDEEKAFAAWKQQYAPKDSGGDYDLRGAFKAGIKPDPQSGHWPDTYKKPNHPTFSDESQYAKQGAPGHWEGETFTPAPQSMTSDERAKDVVPLSEEPGTERHWDADVSSAPAASSGGLGRRGSIAAALTPSTPAPRAGAGAPKERKLTYEELKRMGDEMMAAQKEQTSASLKAGPSVQDSTDFRETPMAASNRALKAQPYSYKPEFAARNGQEPGERNVGPMAQTMAADPVAGTAVGRDPNTGTLTLNRDKFAKVTAGGVADLQEQVDDIKQSLMARRLRGGRR